MLRWKVMRRTWPDEMKELWMDVQAQLLVTQKVAHEKILTKIEDGDAENMRGAVNGKMENR